MVHTKEKFVKKGNCRSKVWLSKIKKDTKLGLPTLFYMVPRDRIELPTRGFSDQIFENLKIL